MVFPSKGSAPFSFCLHCAILLVLLAAGAAAAQAPASVPSSQDLQETLQRAIAQIRAQPGTLAQFDYIMTARVRLLLFWAGKDDVGGGYIRRGVSPDNASAQFYQIVMGSDPAKTPMAINRWGAAWELLHRAPEANPALESDSFVGFMKTSQGTSVAAMQSELAREKKNGVFLFSSILNEANPSANFAKEVPFRSDRDFTINQLEQAEPFVFDRLAGSQGKLLSVDGAQVLSCGRSQGFLSSVAELVDDALQGSRTPISLCYLYNGKRYSLTLQQANPVPQETLRLSLHQDAQPYERTYRDLLRARFENVNEVTGKQTSFELLLGTVGELRGVPVRISYQPNWWFQVVLNLKTPS